MTTTTKMAAWAALLVLSGCVYTGPNGRFDYGMAASTEWIVQCSNLVCCKQRPWDLAAAHQDCRPLAFLNCGQPGDGIGDVEVVHDDDQQRFWYASMITLGAICISSAPQADPFATDRSKMVPASSFNGAANVDRPQLAVSANKVVVMNFDEHTPPGQPEQGTLTTLVFNKWDILTQRATVRTATIVHGNSTPGRLFPLTLQSSFGAGALGWMRLDDGAATIGLITGVPGENGGVNTVSKTMNRGWTFSYRESAPTPIPSTRIDNDSWSRAILMQKPNGTLSVWLLLPVRRNGMTQLHLDVYDGVGPTFDPRLGDAWQIDATGWTVGQSLAVGQDDRALIGFTGVSSTQWPKIEAIAVRRNGQVKRMLIKQEVGPDVNGLARVDFNPVGAWFGGRPNVGTDVWLGVGFDHLVPNPLNFSNPVRTAFFCRANSTTGGDLCTGW